MRKLILAVLGCCLLIPESVQYKFGDIISFKRKCPILNRLTYKHFAVYVGNNPLIGQGNHDIFQRTGPILGINPPKLSDCIFDDLSKEQANKYNIEVKGDNYFDDVDGFTVGTDDEIAQRIKKRLNNCGTYNPFCNNCEHLATYVRYNEPLSLQEGASTSRVCKSDQRKCAAITKFAEELKESYEAHQKCEEMANKEDKTG